MTTITRTDDEGGAGSKEVEQRHADVKRIMAHNAAQPTATLQNMIAEALSRMEELRGQRAGLEAQLEVMTSAEQDTFQDRLTFRDREIARHEAEILALRNDARIDRDETTVRIAAIGDRFDRQLKAIGAMERAQKAVLAELASPATVIENSKEAPIPY